MRHNVRVKLVTEEFGGSCDGFANEVENCNNGECPARKMIFPCIMCICKILSNFLFFLNGPSNFLKKALL